MNQQQHYQNRSALDLKLLKSLLLGTPCSHNNEYHILRITVPGSTAPAAESSSSALAISSSAKPTSTLLPSSTENSSTVLSTTTTSEPSSDSTAAAAAAASSAKPVTAEVKLNNDGGIGLIRVHRVAGQQPSSGWILEAIRRDSNEKNPISHDFFSSSSESIGSNNHNSSDHDDADNDRPFSIIYEFEAPPVSRASEPLISRAGLKLSAVQLQNTPNNDINSNSNISSSSSSRVPWSAMTSDLLDDAALFYLDNRLAVRSADGGLVDLKQGPEIGTLLQAAHDAKVVSRMMIAAPPSTALVTRIPSDAADTAAVVTGRPSFAELARKKAVAPDSPARISITKHHNSEATNTGLDTKYGGNGADDDAGRPDVDEDALIRQLTCLYIDEDEENESNNEHVDNIAASSSISSTNDQPFQREKKPDPSVVDADAQTAAALVVTSAGGVVDWTRQWVSALAVQNPVERIERVNDVMQRFTEAAVEATIRALDYEAREQQRKQKKRAGGGGGGSGSTDRVWLSASMGGVAGGRKVLDSVHGLFLKISVDAFGLYGSDERASKAAAAELRGFEALFSCLSEQTYAKQQLVLPLTCIVRYLGRDVLCSSVLPIGRNTLKLGTADGGISVVGTDQGTGDADVDQTLDNVGRILNLKKHRLGQANGVYSYFGADVEVHRGYDLKYYVVDLARLQPPEWQPTTDTPTPSPRASLPAPSTLTANVDSSPNNGADTDGVASDGYQQDKTGFLTRQLRPEFVSRYQHPLNADALSKFCHIDDRQRDAAAVATATRYLLTVVIPEFARRTLNISCSQPPTVSDLGRLTEQMHSYGINLRFLAYARSLLKRRPSAAAAVEQRLMLLEMIGRALNCEIRRLLRCAVESSSSDQLQTAAATVSRCLAMCADPDDPLFPWFWGLTNDVPTRPDPTEGVNDAVYTHFVLASSGNSSSRHCVGLLATKYGETVAGLAAGSASARGLMPSTDELRALAQSPTDLRLLRDRLIGFTGLEERTGLVPIVKQFHLTAYFDALQCAQRAIHLAKARHLDPSSTATTVRRRRHDQEIEQLFQRSCAQFTESLRARPNDVHSLCAFGHLLGEFSRFYSEEQDELRDKSNRLFSKAVSLSDENQHAILLLWAKEVCSTLKGVVKSVLG